MFQTAVADMTWVIADHTASPGSRELSVTKGQQVEVLDCTSGSEWTLVRLPSASGQSGEAQEGLVPTAVLKHPPQVSCKTSPSKKPPLGPTGIFGREQQSSLNADDGEFISHFLQISNII